MAIHKVCMRCGRKLKTDEAKELGFGKVCWEKFNSEVKYKSLFPDPNCLTQTTSGNESEVDGDARF